MATDDDSGPGLYSLISNYSALVTGNYVLAVKHYSASGTGCYKAFISCTPPRDRGVLPGRRRLQIMTQSACTAARGAYHGGQHLLHAEPVPAAPAERHLRGCAAAGSLQHRRDQRDDGLRRRTTTTRGPEAAPGYRETGPDVTYVLDLQVGDVLTVSYDTPTYDGSIYLVTDCANVATSCVIGEDDPEPETFTYPVTTAGTYYLIADAYTSSTSGTFTLNWLVICALLGACCYSDGSCLMLTRAECLVEPSGVWLGPTSATRTRARARAARVASPTLFVCM